MSIPRVSLNVIGKRLFSVRSVTFTSDTCNAKALEGKHENLSRKVDFRKLNSENKRLFGVLLETQQEKKKRISKASKAQEPSDSTQEVKSKSVSKSKSAVSEASQSNNVSSSSINDASVVGKKERKKKSVENSIVDRPPADDPNLRNVAQRLESDLSYEISTSQLSQAFEESPETQKNHETDKGGSDVFSLGNVEKPKLELKSDSELICGKTITKSDNFYKYPSVTRILSLTMSEGSKKALLTWRSNLIAEMGEQKFQEHHAKTLHLGSLFHSNLQDYLQLEARNTTVLNSDLEGCWKSLEKVFGDISRVKLLESHVVHEKLKYRGVIDCIAMYRDTPLIIEWKKSDKPKLTVDKTYDAPLQLAAYIGALNHDSSYRFKVTKGLVVVAYNYGTTANVYPINERELNVYWKAWIERYKKYADMVYIDGPKENENEALAASSQLSEMQGH